MTDEGDKSKSFQGVNEELDRLFESIAHIELRTSSGFKERVLKRLEKRQVFRPKAAPWRATVMAGLTLAIGAVVLSAPLRFFSRYYDEKSQGVDVFHQQLGMLQEMFCFPPFPMISRLLKHLESQKVSCVLLVHKTWATWRNLLKAHTLASVDIAEPFNSFAFTITHSRGIRVPKKYSFAMEAPYVSFE